MPDLHNEEVILDLESCPHLVYASCCDEHAVLLVEFLIGEDALLVYQDESLLPVPQHLRLLVYFAVYEATRDQRLGHSSNLLLEAFS